MSLDGEEWRKGVPLSHMWACWACVELINWGPRALSEMRCATCGRDLTNLQALFEERPELGSTFLLAGHDGVQVALEREREERKLAAARRRARKPFHKPG